MVDPCALLWYLCDNSKTFSDYLESEVQANPPTEGTPWTLILYSDEVSPGNQLKADNRHTYDFDHAVLMLYVLVC